MRWRKRYQQLGSIAVLLALAMGSSGRAIAQDIPTGDAENLCGLPALSRIQTHVVQPGETLEAIAAQYGLIPSTLMGLNPALQQGSLSSGMSLQIPPYNGIRVTVPSGTTWQDLSRQYNVRADVLFEVNGCARSPAATTFIPGVNWSPGTATSPTLEDSPINGYPLPEPAEVATGYGWQLDPVSGEVVFHSGVDLVAALGTPVLAVGNGIVAFAADQGNYGNLVVINHSQGLQTRYAHLDSLQVTVGQQVQQGHQLGTVGETGLAAFPHLHFEVRTNSDLGWVARDPSDYVPQTSLMRR
ncbi:MAG: M23 family metallopeptidase [Leptolyngbya sp. DLM2.Bin15]|nr:MAG: M23 family metallopeptidase [Leptolyngbya sp. DLM2.Bin15]